MYLFLYMRSRDLKFKIKDVTVFAPSGIQLSGYNTIESKVVETSSIMQNTFESDLRDQAYDLQLYLANTMTRYTVETTIRWLASSLISSIVDKDLLTMTKIHAGDYLLNLVLTTFMFFQSVNLIMLYYNGRMKELLQELDKNNIQLYTTLYLKILLSYANLDDTYNYYRSGDSENNRIQQRVRFGWIPDIFLLSYGQQVHTGYIKGLMKKFMNTTNNMQVKRQIRESCEKISKAKGYNDLFKTINTIPMTIEGMHAPTKIEMYLKVLTHINSGHTQHNFVKPGWLDSLYTPDDNTINLLNMFLNINRTFATLVRLLNIKTVLVDNLDLDILRARVENLTSFMTIDGNIVSGNASETTTELYLTGMLGHTILGVDPAPFANVMYNRLYISPETYKYINANKVFQCASVHFNCATPQIQLSQFYCTDELAKELYKESLESTFLHTKGRRVIFNDNTFSNYQVDTELSPKPRVFYSLKAGFDGIYLGTRDVEVWAEKFSIAACVGEVPEIENNQNEDQDGNQDNNQEENENENENSIIRLIKTKNEEYYLVEGVKMGYLDLYIVQEESVSKEVSKTFKRIKNADYQWSRIVLTGSEPLREKPMFGISINKNLYREEKNGEIILNDQVKFYDIVMAVIIKTIIDRLVDKYEDYDDNIFTALYFSRKKLDDFKTKFDIQLKDISLPLRIGNMIIYVEIQDNKKVLCASYIEYKEETSSYIEEQSSKQMTIIAYPVHYDLMRTDYTEFNYVQIRNNKYIILFRNIENLKFLYLVHEVGVFNEMEYHALDYTAKNRNDIICRNTPVYMLKKKERNINRLESITRKRLNFERRLNKKMMWSLIKDKLLRK